jgi:hypothetical protein
MQKRDAFKQFNGQQNISIPAEGEKKRGKGGV